MKLNSSSIVFYQYLSRQCKSYLPGILFYLFEVVSLIPFSAAAKQAFSDWLSA